MKNWKAMNARRDANWKSLDDLDSLSGEARDIALYRLLIDLAQDTGVRRFAKGVKTAYCYAVQRIFTRAERSVAFEMRQLRRERRVA